MAPLARLKTRARQLKAETYAVYLACRDPRTPWYARALAVAVVAYAFSPVDLVPDFVPVLGYLDDLVLVPLGIALTIRMIPPEVMAVARIKAATDLAEDRPTNWVAGAIVIGMWVLVIALIVTVALHVV